MWSRASWRFLATTVLTAAARSLDAWSTWMATPDLRLEANPLARVLHIGWWGLLLVNALVVAVIAMAAWRAAFRPPEVPRDPGLDLPAFVGRYWFSRRDRYTVRHAMLWLPADRRVRWAFIGGPGAVLVIAGSVMAAGWNLLVANGIVAGRAAGRAGIALFWTAVLVGLCVAVDVFLRRAYRRYTRATSVRAFG